MLDAAALIVAERPEVQFALVVAPSLSTAEAQQILCAEMRTRIFSRRSDLSSSKREEALFAADAAASPAAQLRWKLLYWALQWS